MKEFFFAMCLLSVAAAACFGTTRPVEGTAQDQVLSSRPVSSFKAEGLTMIDALMELARSEHVPLGIEYANPDDFVRAVNVDLGSTTLGQAFEALLPGNKSYSIRVHDGVVHLVNSAVSAKRPTLLDQVVPEFSAAPDHGNPLTVVMASNLLRLNLEQLFSPKPPSPSSGPVGIVATLPSGLLKNEIGPLRLRNKTVRQILDRLVSEHNNSAWIILVPPAELKHLPRHGQYWSVNDLWLILEYNLSPLRWSDNLLGLLRSNWGSRKAN
jgi:hypothetical protein